MTIQVTQPEAGVSYSVASLSVSGNGSIGGTLSVTGLTTLGPVVATYIGLGASGSASSPVNIANNINGNLGIAIANSSSGDAADTGLFVTNSSHLALFTFLSTGFTPSGLLAADQQLIETNGVGGILVNSVAAAPIVFGVSNTEVGRFSAQGSLVLGSGAGGTTDTDNFLYLVTCAGTPTGVPTAQTGRVALRYDTTNHKLYAYDGGWKSVTLS